MSRRQTGDRSLIRRLLASVLAAVVLVFVGAGLLFADAVQRHISREMEARLRSIAVDVLSGLTFDPGGMAILNRLPDDPSFEERLSGWYWQIKTGSDTIARSRSLSARRPARACGVRIRRGRTSRHAVARRQRGAGARQPLAPGHHPGQRTAARDR